MASYRPFTASFWEKVDRRGDDECWPWLAAVVSSGYGNVRQGNRTRLAHVVAYELTVGPIPEGFQVHHDCGNKLCVNTRHMTPCTPAAHAARHRERSK